MVLETARQIEVKVYIASDGKEFASESSAKAHELELIIQRERKAVDDKFKKLKVIKLEIPPMFDHADIYEHGMIAVLISSHDDYETVVRHYKHFYSILGLGNDEEVYEYGGIKNNLGKWFVVVPKTWYDQYHEADVSLHFLLADNVLLQAKHLIDSISNINKFEAIKKVLNKT